MPGPMVACAISTGAMLPVFISAMAPGSSARRGIEEAPA